MAKSIMRRICAQRY